MRAQMELEWRRCCENTKTEHRVNEQLIKGLAQNKNQVSVKWNQKHLFDDDDVKFMMMRTKMVLMLSLF